VCLDCGGSPMNGYDTCFDCGSDNLAVGV